MTRDNVDGELVEVVAGINAAALKPPRSHFDSTGMALQYVVAAAAVVYEKVVTEGLGRRMDFAG